MTLRLTALAVLTTAPLLAVTLPPAAPAAPAGTIASADLPRGQQQVSTTITVGSGNPSHIAIPDFVALDTSADTVSAAKTIPEVLWDDLAFEQEFDPIPRRTYATVPAATTIEAVPFDQWAQLGANFVVFGTVKTAGSEIDVEVRVLYVSDHRQVFGKDYHSTSHNFRAYAHKASDELHKALAVLDGVAQTRIVFASDRDGERLGGTIQQRSVKEIYVADYDGANQVRVTANRSLNLLPTWVPPGDQAIAYTSYSTGNQDIVLQKFGAPVATRPIAVVGGAPNTMIAWSPDGSKIAFVTDRNHDGRYEIWIQNRDGSGLHRFPGPPGGADESPAFSPTGAELAFVSDVTGTPQIYIANLDGTALRRITRTESHCDRPTWAPDGSSIAYSAQTPSSGNDIKLFVFADNSSRQITTGEGMNESPSFAPNGRHILFTTTRWGKSEIASVGLDGKNVRQVTRVGNNTYPSWGHLVR